jgi:hypothetical protein
MSDLIVIGYPDETAAQDVWEELVKLAIYDGRPQRPDRRARTASRDPTRTSDVAPHRKQQSGNEANKRAGEVDR